MPHVTLVMARKPIAERFRAVGGARKGAPFGSTAAVVGGRVAGADECAVPAEPVAQLASAVDGDDVEVRHEFHAVERCRGDDDGRSGASGLMLAPRRPPVPCDLTFEEGDPIVAQVDRDGRRLRARGHGLVRQGGRGPAGILIHEAPHVGWLTGRTSPRRATDGRDPGASPAARRAMERTFEAMGAGRRASLVVLDGRGPAVVAGAAPARTRSPRVRRSGARAPAHRPAGTSVPSSVRRSRPPRSSSMRR